MSLSISVMCRRVGAMRKEYVVSKTKVCEGAGVVVVNADVVMRVTPFFYE